MFASSHAAVRRGSAALTVGCLLILSVAALRLLFDADEQQTRFLGRPVGTACWFKARFGVPCPNCGMTRSAILASRGEILRAARIAPGGPALVICLLTVGAGVASLGAIQRWGRASQVLRAQSAMRVVVIACGSVAASVWIGGWMVEVARCLKQR
ncbi:MAG: DUF2752 domain-containing protein [Bryobacteraceae bacterium]|jgi:hypothetical protein